ncbi:bifunctional folylpolyglutamate synthase/dihydrofolate synthase [Fructilactobacillus myrtifloralis]|uniref:tetrahydrofolate synthase n=1 Tax=Fructilactobacillus myrtifloralis TaxID=2940301 RepID=A0ABY5BQ42_9LACO|nr:folylpolyglutamate synthase/dihydrofolate synthase family protein [Fructilactobacillus myrtifloralis]USS85162.1 bifunctional folylpolyglutamate synthase/dihydrofolate synthase [Fructilactobacillus myrtifloralis]
MTDYQAALHYIHSRPRVQKEASQRRINELLRRLGHPERQLATIHVVGTNGKGSVVAYLQQLLQASGLRVGTFTSPFIVRFNERMMINRIPISDAELIRLVAHVKPLVAAMEAQDPTLGPSEFEVITALMYQYFNEQGVDLAIVEAGIGGQSDSTNVADRALLTVITTIGLDHMQILGDTVAAIARDKAGMIRNQVPTVAGRFPTDANRIVQTVAQQHHSPVLQLDRQFRYQPQTRTSFSFLDSQGLIPNVPTSMLGDFEMEDAALAIAAFRTLSQTTLQLVPAQSSRIVRQAIVQTRWPGRMEVVHVNPKVLLDGAHNVPAINRLCETLAAFPERTLNVVFAAFSDKQFYQMRTRLAQEPRVHLYLTTFQGSGTRSSAPLQPADALEAELIPEWKTAVQTAMQATPADGMTIVTGSLLFIATVRNWFVQGDKP